MLSDPERDTHPDAGPDPAGADVDGTPSVAAPDPLTTTPPLDPPPPPAPPTKELPSAGPLPLSLAPTCPSCGAAVEADWRHCGACGTPLDGVVAPAPPAAPSGRRRTRPHQRLVIDQPALFLGALILVLLLGAAAAIVSERRLDDKQSQLDTTRRTLQDTETVLAAVRGELGERVKERDALKADLEKTRSSLNDAERSVRSQGEQLETFKNCLGAIEEIGQALDRGDNAAARAAADRADRHCTEAVALL